jgi:hypothetical protein
VADAVPVAVDRLDQAERSFLAQVVVRFAAAVVPRGEPQCQRQGDLDHLLPEAAVSSRTRRQRGHVAQHALHPLLVDLR